MEQIHDCLPFDGFRYRLNHPKIMLSGGRQQGHKYAYKLNLEKDEPGQLVIYRGRKFAESELVMLESLLCSLPFPLRSSIEYRKASLSPYRDPLTGINNRTMLDTVLMREMCLA